MKRAITTLMAAMLLGLTFTACDKEDTTGGNNGGGNNNGTVITDDDMGIELNMRNDDSDRIYFETNFIKDNGVISTAEIYLHMTSSNNFDLNCDYNSYWMNYDIARVGTVAGMSAITNIPTSGWVEQVAVNPGNGYVIRYKGQGFGYKYARLYVKDWIVSTSGGIIGATVVYQDKWGQSGNSNESLFGTSWYWTGEETIDDITHTIRWTLAFSSSSFTGTMETIDISSEGYYTDNSSFTYTYENNHGELTEIIPELSSSEWPVYSFVVEGNVLTLTYTDPTTGASSSVQLYRQ